MKMNITVDKKVLTRYAEIVGKIAGQKVDVDEIKLTGEVKGKGFANRVYEKEAVAHFESEVSDQFILEFLDIIDKHNSELKKITTGFLMILKGCNAFLSGMMKDLKKMKEKYA